MLPLICPTCQIASQDAQHHDPQPSATVHGVVFEILLCRHGSQGSTEVKLREKALSAAAADRPGSGVAADRRAELEVALSVPGYSGALP
jgi:hypothetical protein